MKKLVFTALAAFCGTIASGQGTVFHDISFDEALRMAAEQGKNVFVDCYTSWCGPCKNMTDNVFPQEKVGEYFNPRFICVKYDIEKEEDGKKIASEQGVRSIPTFLVFRPDGSLMHKIVGGGEADKFIENVDQSFDNDIAHGAIKTIYEKGGTDKEFLLHCIESFTTLDDPEILKAIDELIRVSTKDELTGPDYWFIYSNRKLSPEGSANERFLFDNYREFREGVGREKADKEIGKRYRAILMDAIGSKSEMTGTEFGNLADDIARTGLPAEYELDFLCDLARAVITGDIDRQLELADARFSTMDKGNNLYYKISDNIMTNGTQEQKQALIRIAEEIVVNLSGNDRTWMEAVINFYREKI